MPHLGSATTSWKRQSELDHKEFDTLSVWKSSDNNGIHTDDVFESAPKSSLVFVNDHKIQSEKWLINLWNCKSVLKFEFMALLIVELAVFARSLFH
jgi:hypothetical protein